MVESMFMFSMNIDSTITSTNKNQYLRQQKC